MSFELVNALISFQSHINKTLHTFFDICVQVYFDDILIYSMTQKEHIKHVKSVLRRLRQHDLYAKLSKCEFSVIELDFLSFRISAEEVSMKDFKIISIKN